MRIDESSAHLPLGYNLMSFRSVFVACVIAFALILSAFLINRARPKAETQQPTADFVRRLYAVGMSAARVREDPSQPA